MKPGPANLARSVHQRLLNVATKNGEDFGQILVRYALERLLYRLSKSPHASQFVLKGALLFRLWFSLEQRPTRDADFLGFGVEDPDHLAGIFREICESDVGAADDGLVFDARSVSAGRIREAAGYPGVRVEMKAKLGNARIRIQCDVGFGDAITPAPTMKNYPVLLDLPAPVLAVYPLETVVAEKLEAMVKLADFNSRMKDFFDLWVLTNFEELDRELIVAAIRATFGRRKTALPESVPIGLTAAFAQGKEIMWQAFLTRSNLKAPPLDSVVQELERYYWPLLKSTAPPSRDVSG